MFDRFSHFLSYGATDQQTVLELLGRYDGLIVPGTVAAFQREGTGGFVLSLSATVDAPPYLIDPRFPLFQKANSAPKKSHRALAALLGAPQLITPEEPTPEDFTDDLIDVIARNWIQFNITYEDLQVGKFEKYAKRLGEAVDESARSGPEGIIAPYLVAVGDDWWSRAEALMAASVAAAPQGTEVLRVLAAVAAPELDRRLGEISDERVIVWLSDLRELEVDPRVLAEYGAAIRGAERRGQSCFALYGGFFSVMLGAVGLRGSCHGIGYGEFRSWPDLPQSGPPPARYYAPRFHRYIGQDLAYQLWSRDPGLTVCACPVCREGPPVLGYHDLMKHSVFARHAEIEEWGDLGLSEMHARFDSEREQLVKDLTDANLPEPLRNPVSRATYHLPRWSEALGLLREA